MARGAGRVVTRNYERNGRAWTRYIARVDRGPGRDKNGRRRASVLEERSFTRKRDAEAWLLEQRTELRRRRAPVDRRVERGTVGALLEAWLEHGKGPKGTPWSPVHERRTRQIVDVNLAPLAHLPVEDLAVADVRALLDARERRGASGNTRRLIRGALSAALNFAIANEMLPPGANVAQRAKGPKVLRKPPSILPPHLIPAFVGGLARERYRPIILTALALALRPSEAVGLRWGNVDLDGGLVTISGSVQYVDRNIRRVRDRKRNSFAVEVVTRAGYHERPQPKDDEPRTIALPRFLADELREHRRAQLAERGLDPDLQTHPRSIGPGLVFTTRAGGPVHEPAVNRRLKVIVDRINAELAAADGPRPAPELLPRVTFYQLRHTGATWMLAEGVPEHELQAIMGHSSPAMTRRYAQILEPQRRAAAERLDAFMRRVSEHAS